ncbi:MAG: hypothetical protein [Caudoviricetes sp.]|nr:MAG: hypothetical protein [Caudoviricetes sp.]
MQHTTTTTMPLSGQFGAVYQGPDGSKYSATFKWVEGRLFAYNMFLDKWSNIEQRGYSQQWLVYAASVYIISED